MALAQPVRFVKRGGEHDVSGIASPRLDTVWIGTVEPDLDARAPNFDAREHARHLVVEVGMIGVQHEHGAKQLDRCEILVLVYRFGAKNFTQ